MPGDKESTGKGPEAHSGLQKGEQEKRDLPWAGLRPGETGPPSGPWNGLHEGHLAFLNQLQWPEEAPNRSCTHPGTPILTAICNWQRNKRYFGLISFYFLKLLFSLKTYSPSQPNCSGTLGGTMQQYCAKDGLQVTYKWHLPRPNECFLF